MVVLVRSDAAGAEVADKLWITIMMSGRPAGAAMVAVTAMTIATTVEVWVNIGYQVHVVAAKSAKSMSIFGIHFCGRISNDQQR